MEKEYSYHVPACIFQGLEHMVAYYCFKDLNDHLLAQPTVLSLGL